MNKNISRTSFQTIPNILFGWSLVGAIFYVNLGMKID